jgi:hypothetical protein
MSGLLALVCRQYWCCEAHGCNCSAKNQPCDFCHDFRPREWANKSIFCYLRRAEDWVTLPQIPSRFLEHNAEPVDTAGHVSQRLVRLYERIG